MVLEACILSEKRCKLLPLERIGEVGATLQPVITMDAVMTAGEEKLSVNLTVLPLMTEAERIMYFSAS